MNRFPHLSNAPIVEAVIDIRFQCGQDWESSLIKEKLKEKLSDYPIIMEQRKYSAKITHNMNDFPHTSAKEIGIVGFELRSQNEIEIAKFQKDGFLFSRLKPYNNWDLFFKEARRLWEIYYDIIKPETALRVGLRFINRFEFNEQILCDKIFTFPPKHPSGLKDELKGFLHRDILIVPGKPYEVNYIRVLEKTEMKSIFIVDIDVYLMTHLNFKEIWDIHLKEMRFIKNNLFFKSIKKNILEEMK